MSKKNSEGKDAVDFLNEASELIDKEKFKDAAGLLTEAIRLCGHPRLFFNRGYCYHQLKDSKNAIKDFTKSIASDRGTDLLEHEKQRLYLYLGIIYEDNDEDDKAIESYKKAADRGYSGAIARLEKFGVTYIPQLNEETEIKKINTAAVTKPKPAPAAAFESAAAMALINKPRKKSKLRFLFPCLLGIACGAGVFFLLQNISQKVSVSRTVKQTVITAVVISDTLNLRAEPLTYSETLKVLYKNYIVEITGEELSGFTPVSFDGVKGWVDSHQIETQR